MRQLPDANPPLKEQNQKRLRRVKSATSGGQRDCPVKGQKQKFKLTHDPSFGFYGPSSCSNLPQQHFHDPVIAVFFQDQVGALPGWQDVFGEVDEVDGTPYLQRTRGCLIVRQ